MSDDVGRTTSTHVALREATHALCAVRGARGTRLPLSETDCQGLAGDLVGTLDALGSLLRLAGLPGLPATSAAGHSLQAIVQQLSVTASLARRAAGEDIGGVRRTAEATRLRAGEARRRAGVTRERPGPPREPAGGPDD